MHVWHVQMVAEQQPLSTHPAFLQAVAELGTHRPSPLPSWQGSRALQPGACRDLGPAGCSGKKEREEARTTPPFSLPHPQVHKSPSLDLEC